MAAILNGPVCIECGDEIPLDTIEHWNDPHHEGLCCDCFAIEGSTGTLNN